MENKDNIGDKITSYVVGTAGTYIFGTGIKDIFNLSSQLSYFIGMFVSMGVMLLIALPKIAEIKRRR